MAARPLTLDAVTRAERHQAVDAASTAIQQAGGWIEDVHFFSNLSVTLRAMVPAAAVASLPAALEATGIRLAAAPQPGEAPAELPIALLISFLHDEPDLRREVPSVPG